MSEADGNSVFPARAGMIRRPRSSSPTPHGIPRESGDDPAEQES